MLQFAGSFLKSKPAIYLAGMATTFGALIAWLAWCDRIAGVRSNETNEIRAYVPRTDESAVMPLRPSRGGASRLTIMGCPWESVAGASEPAGDDVVTLFTTGGALPEDFTPDSAA